MTQDSQFQTDVLEHFIPITLDRLIADLIRQQEFAAEQKTQFKHFCRCYQAIQHAQTHRHILQLKKLYTPVNPDEDCLIHSDYEAESSLKALKAELLAVLNKANYQRLSEQELNTALNKVSPHGVQVSVDFDDFADIILMYRGSAVRNMAIRRWNTLFLKKETAQVHIFRRLFVLIQPQNRQRWLDYLVRDKKMSVRKARKKVDNTFQSLGVSGDEDVVYLKVFKDIPQDDLEMLFPNTRVKIRLFDKIKLTIMGGGGATGGVMAGISKFSAAVDPVSAMIAIGGLLGVLWRQIAKIFSQRAKYHAILTKNLYFYNLDNNMGAITYILDAAEAEECKEALLAYFFLLLKGPSSRQVLDQAIENYLYDNYQAKMDFEVTDGLAKLSAAGLLQQSGKSYQAAPLDEAVSQLSEQWRRLL